MGLFSRLPIDKTQIETAIEELEQQSSAEVRVYIERKMPRAVKNSFDRAFEIFYQLEMGNTKNCNAVLIYIAIDAQQCTIIGDEAIHQFVGEEFWQQTCDSMVSFFRRKEFTLGIIYAIGKIGKELSANFPMEDNDSNELPNEVIIRG